MNARGLGFESPRAARAGLLSIAEVMRTRKATFQAGWIGLSPYIKV